MLDPDAAWAALTGALADGEPELAGDTATRLAEWIACGGYLPRELARLVRGTR
jgi:hypothetical protein